jgi:hypothetical protein
LRSVHSLASAPQSKCTARAGAACGACADGGSGSSRYSSTPPAAASAATPSITLGHGSAAPSPRSACALAEPTISAPISSPSALPRPSGNHCAASFMPTG